MLLGASSYRYHSVVKDRRTLLLRSKELAYTQMRYSYRRLTILLQRDGWRMGKKLVYRRYRQENFCVRSKQPNKRAAQTRVPLAAATAAHQRWSMRFHVGAIRERGLLTGADHHRSIYSRVPAVVGRCIPNPPVSGQVILGVKYAGQ